MNSPNDRMDISPVDGRTDLKLSFDLDTGTLSGDVLTNKGFSQGDGDVGPTPMSGGQIGKLVFFLGMRDGPDAPGRR